MSYEVFLVKVKHFMSCDTIKMYVTHEGAVFQQQLSSLIFSFKKIQQQALSKIQQYKHGNLFYL